VHQIEKVIDCTQLENKEVKEYNFIGDKAMAGIAGIKCDGKQELVTQMLERITHRGKAGSKVVESHGATLGAVWPEAQTAPASATLQRQAAWDGDSPLVPDPAALERTWQPFALAAATPDGLSLARDPLGVKPLYYGRTDDGSLCFASEVKALMNVAREIQEFPPGAWYDDREGIQTFSEIESPDVSQHSPDQIASELRLRLEQAVCKRVDDEVMGCWLSGGLDSSAMAALARPHVRELHTFSAGLPNAPDLKFAHKMAEFLHAEHHEVCVTLNEILAALPKVIYHLESFDALLVRSSVTNYLAAQRAAEYVGAVFSGEGADELFAGYAYLETIEPDRLSDELMDITHRLHNTALQRVDRSASAHGLVAHVPFLDPDVVEHASHIPASLKLKEEGEMIEKWILRRALTDALPEDVLWRRKAKFWQGAGVGDLLAQYAEERITDADFRRERTLPNGWTLDTREELMYYRIFKEQFGELKDLSWMGRTKGAPRCGEIV
jgi:asparagine synthase (glutamine-hydrolysing)